MKKAIAIINPAARHGKALSLAEPAIDVLKKNFDLEVVMTSHIGHAKELGSNIADDQLIVAVGGDGTVHELINGILASGKKNCVVGIVPVGSGNDSARAIGMPSCPIKAAEEICKMKIHYVDIGRCNDIYYSNSLGLGMDARVARAAYNLRNRSNLKGIPLYLRALQKVLSEWEAYFLIISLNKKVIETRASLLAANIGRSYGGGFFVTPHAYVDDGLLDICLIEAIDAWQVFFRVPFLIPGKHEWMKKVHTFRTMSLTVMPDKEVDIQLDGEIYNFDYAEINIHEKAIKVCVSLNGYFYDKSGKFIDLTLDSLTFSGEREAK